MTPLAGWENFYVIVGSSAGALIGLQFVVITLIADTPIEQADAQAGGAFATPSVVHFGVVLFLSAIVSAPWSSLTPVSLLWGLVGLSGIACSIIVARRLRRQTAYKPVLEDQVSLCLRFAACTIVSNYAKFKIVNADLQKANSAGFSGPGESHEGPGSPNPDVYCR